MDSVALYILALSVLPVATAIGALAVQVRRLGLMHIYLVFVALSYGAYTFIDVLVNGAEGVDAAAAATLMITITFTMIVMAMVFSVLPRRLAEQISLSNLTREAQSAPFGPLVLLWSAVMTWSVFAYLNYGVVASYSEEELGATLFEIPRWLGPVRQLSIAVAFGLFVWLVARLVLKEQRQKFGPQLFMLIAIVLLLALNGRRVFLSMVVVGALIYAVERGHITRMFSLGNVFRVVVALVLVVVFSNVFQSIRHTYLLHSALVPEEDASVGLVEALTNWQATAENLEARTAIWRFHYYIMASQIEDFTNVIGGALFWEGLIGAIPQVLYPDKPAVYGDDVLTCLHYSLTCPGVGLADIDYPQTILSTMQADFGLLFIFLVPACLYTVLLVVARYSSLAGKGTINPVLFILVFGMATELLVNVEQSVGTYFIWVRDVALVTLCIALFGMLRGSTRARPWSVLQQGTPQRGLKGERAPGTAVGPRRLADGQ